MKLLEADNKLYEFLCILLCCKILYCDVVFLTDMTEIDSEKKPEMAFKYDLSTIKIKYTGSIDSFVEKFKEIAVLRDYTDTKKVLAFQTLIDGHDRVLLESIPSSEKYTIDKIQNILTKHFEGDSWRWGVETNLQARKQLATETLDDYACDILHLCKQIKKSESEQLSLYCLCVV